MKEKNLNNDIDAVELQEWLDAVTTVVQYEGPDRAKDILSKSLAHANQLGVDTPGLASSSYVNTASALPS